jgi:hypothetical protein
MPPGASAQANRIGLAVGIDDAGDASLAYLREVASLVSRINSEGRAISNIRLPGQRANEAQSQPKQKAQEATRAFQEQSRQLSLLDKIDEQTNVAQRRRATDTSTHLIREGRRAADAFAHSTRSMAEQLKGLTDEQFKVFSATRRLDDPQIVSEWERRVSASSTRRHTEGYGPPPEPAPGSHAARQAREKALNEAQRPLTFGKSPLGPLDETGLDEAQAFRDKAIRRHIQSQQRKAIIEDFDREQRLSSTPARERAREEADISTEAQLKFQRRQRNVRINQSVEEKERAEAQAAETARRDAQARNAEFRARFQSRIGEASTKDLRQGATKLRQGDELAQFQRQTVADELRRRRAAQQAERATQQEEAEQSRIRDRYRSIRANFQRERQSAYEKTPEYAQEQERARAEAQAARQRANEERAATTASRIRQAERQGAAAQLQTEAEREGQRIRNRVMRSAARSQLGLGESAEEVAQRQAEQRNRRRTRSARAENALPEDDIREEVRATEAVRRRRARIQRRERLANLDDTELYEEERAREITRTRRTRQRASVLGGKSDESILEEERAREAQRRRTERARSQARGSAAPDYDTTYRAEERRVATAEQRQRARANILPFDVDAAQKELGTATDKLRRFRDEASKISIRRQGADVGHDAQRLTRELVLAQKAARNLYEELAQPGNMRRTRAEVERDLRAIVTRAKDAENELRRIRTEEQGLPATGNPAQSTASVTGRIIRNMAIRAGIFYAAYDLKRFTADSLEAARVAALTERQLAATSRQSGVAFTDNLRIAEQIRNNADLSRLEAQAVTSNVTRFAARANRRSESDQFSRAITDLAAARGIENKNLAQAVDTLFRGGRGVEEILGRDPEEIIKDYAKRAVRAKPQLPTTLFVGPERPQFKTETERIAEYVSKLTDAQKAEIFWVEAMKQGNAAAGEAIRRHNSLEGQLDSTTARWNDAKVAVGEFVGGLTPLQRILTSISGTLNGMNTDKLRLIGTGPNGLITGVDIANAGRARANTTSAIVSRNYDAYSSGIEGAIGVGLLSRYGPGVQEAATSGAKRIAGSVKDLTLRLTGQAEAAVAAEGEAAASSGAAGVAAIGAVLILATSLITGRIRKSAEENLARVEAEAGAANQANLQAQDEVATGRAFFRSRLVGTDLTRRYAGNELTAQQRSAAIQGNPNADFSLGRMSDDEWKEQNDRIAREKEANEVIERNRADFWARLAAEDEKERQENAQIQNAALARIRETVAGSFRTVEEVAQAATPGNNPFVKIFVDGATTAQRMKEQWGFLGDATVDYFTKLELGRIQLGLTSERFKSLASSMELVNKAQSEIDQRKLSPELTGQEQAVGRLTQSYIKYIQTIPQLRAEYSTVINNIRPGRFYREAVTHDQLDDLRRVQTTLRIGLDKQGQREIDRYVNEAILGITRNFTPAQIRNRPWLRDAYARANIGTQNEAAYQIQDELARIEIQARERQRLLANVGDIEGLRKQTEESVYRGAINEKRGTMFQGRFVGTLTPQEQMQLRALGQESDKALINLTDRMNPREMGSALFEARNEAIRREATRQTQMENEALVAAQTGVQYQGQMLQYLKLLSDAVVSGNIGLAITVANETQARIDAERLRDANQGVPVTINTGSSRVNPYSSSMGRYGRGGRTN